MSLLERLVAFLHLPVRTPERVEVIADDAGVRRVRNRRVSIAFSWSDVTEVRVFKRDLWIIDDVRLTFHVGDWWYEFSEEEDGFAVLGEKMRQALPDVPADWYEEVVQPPFATNERVLYRRVAKVGTSE